MSRKRRERREAQRAMAVAQQGGRRVNESFVFQGTEFVDRRDWMPVQFGFAGLQGAGLNLMTSLNDRKDGRNAPFVENEYDANTIRGFARFITTINCPGIGIVENLQNYIIGRGIKATVTAKKGRQVPEGFVEAAQDVIDEFNEDNKIIGNFDRESLLRDRRDGECYVGLYPKKGKTHLRSLEPDNVRDPHGVPFTDEFLNEHFGLCIEYATRWNWGHHTDEHDIENCHGLCVQWSASEDYDYLPRKYWHHSKVNVDRCVIRGMSDWYPAWKWLKQQERLLSNTGEGAAELAAIAYITQFANATQEQARSMRERQADYQYSRQGVNGATNTVYKHVRDPGTVLNVPQGQEYLPGPMGHERGQAFLGVVQGILRQVGTRWCMTEGMISGDDSNNNMASSVEAGGRFWKYADASQGRECAKWQEIYTRVLQNAFDMGRFERFGVTWDEIRRAIVVTVTCPEIDVRDPKILAETREIEMEAGILSAKTWADEAGYDYDKEVAQGAKRTSQQDGMGGPGGPGGGPGHPGGPGGPGEGPGGLPGGPAAPQQRQPGEWEDKSRMQWKRNVKAITDVVQALQAKTISAIQAKVQLGMLGMNPDRIDSLLEDVEDDGQMNDPRNVQDLAESFAGHCSSRWRMLREGSPPFSPVAESGGGNPNHDPSNGQFASGGGSSGGGASSSKSPAAKESGSRKDLKAKYPRWTGEKVDGREVIRKIDNESSIEASVPNADHMPGIRVIDTKHFETFGNGKIDYYAADDHERVKKLAAAMKESGKIKPLIVVVDDKGPYILEGGHRYEALKLLGAKSFPAKVVIDRDNLPRPAARASGGPKFTKKPEDAPQVPPASGRAKRTETREFKKWFGDSKVVDSAGKPLVVYHGTADDFEVFAHGQAGRDNTSDSKLAHFFSSNPDVADEWTWKKGDQTGSIKPVFLKMENPLVVKGTKYYDPKHHLDSIKKAIADGHDGVIFKGQGSLTGSSDHYAVIDPRNIKSASGNQGTYNPKSVHIGESRFLGTGLDPFIDYP